MSFRFLSLAVFSLGAICMVGPASVLADERVAVDVDFVERRQSHEAETLQTLSTLVAVNFENTPLREALATLSEQHRVEFAVNVRQLNEEGYNAEETFSLAAKDIPLRSVLSRILEHEIGDLDWFVSGRQVIITTATVVEYEGLQTRAYEVTSLVGELPEELIPDCECDSADRQPASKSSDDEPGATSEEKAAPVPGAGAGFFSIGRISPQFGGDGMGGSCGVLAPGNHARGLVSRFDFGSLIDAIESTVVPSTWQSYGGEASITPLVIGSQRVLVVRQTRRGHEELAALLTQLRAFVSDDD